MGQILHSCAKTTEAVRRAIQNSQESIAKLAVHYNLNPKTVVKWKNAHLSRTLQWVQSSQDQRF